MKRITSLRGFGSDEDTAGTSPRAGQRMVKDTDGWMRTKGFVLLARAHQLDLMLLEQVEEDTTYGIVINDTRNVNLHGLANSRQYSWALQRSFYHRKEILEARWNPFHFYLILPAQGDWHTRLQESINHL